MHHVLEEIARTVPFAAVLATNPPTDRPLLTKAAEMALVALIAAVGALQVRTSDAATTLALVDARLRQIELDLAEIRRDNKLYARPYEGRPNTKPKPQPTR